MSLRGVRGATTAEANEQELVLAATARLLEEMVSRNAIVAEDVAAALFSVTADLDVAFPATAARRLGWQWVPLFDAREIPVAGDLARCIRVLLLWNTETPQREIRHVYQGEAAKLRPDLQAGLQGTSSEEGCQ